MLGRLISYTKMEVLKKGNRYTYTLFLYIYTLLFIHVHPTFYTRTPYFFIHIHLCNLTE
jgi:hypothetical protein